MKALGLVVSDKIFESCILKTYFLTPWPTNQIDQILVEDYPGTIAVEFGKIPIRGSR